MSLPYPAGLTLNGLTESSGSSRFLPASTALHRKSNRRAGKCRGILLTSAQHTETETASQRRDLDSFRPYSFLLQVGQSAAQYVVQTPEQRFSVDMASGIRGIYVLFSNFGWLRV